MGLAIVLTCALYACGGGGSSPPSAAGTTGALPTAATGDANAVPLYVDGGVPLNLGFTLPNAIYVDIDVCAPGGAECAIINHVLVDTGSVGLRLVASAIHAANPALPAAMPQASTAAGAVTGECLPFASGTTWGGVRSADLHWGGTNYSGETAADIPIQVIDDTDSRVASTPSACSGMGSPMQTVSALGGNGIIGIGLFAQDCGSYCAQTTATPIYYQCSSAGCSPVTMPTSQQVSNPVSSAAADNNGSMISLPSGGAVQSNGLLILGIGTRANNAVDSASVVLGASTTGSTVGDFSASFNGNTLPQSYIDSGSTSNFLPATGTVPLPACSNGPLAGTGYTCPGSSVTLTASNTGTQGTAGSASVLVMDANQAVQSQPTFNAIPGLASAEAASNITMDLGASFFFGRVISTLIEYQSASGFAVAGPAFAYTP
ncbi:MAG: DUF3443 family protein [Rhodoferax sp.]